MKPVFKNQRFLRNSDGAAALEFAIVGPIFLMMLFGLFHLGAYFFGLHQAQRASEQTAREVRLLDMPEKDEILELLKTNAKSPIGGKYEADVQLIDKFGGTYAEISVNYTYSPPIPFLDRVTFTKEAGTNVRLRSMPAR